MLTELNECKLASAERWAKVEIEITKLKDNINVMEARLNKQAAMVADIQELSKSVSLLANNMDAMLKEQRLQNTRIQTLEQKPAKKWESIVDKIISVIVAALVGALLIKLGLPQ